ncbi:hypothetical protein [Streptomyces sp. NBC_01538]
MPPVTLDQPRTPGSVFFRVKAVDTKGTRVTRPLINACRTTR